MTVTLPHLPTPSSRSPGPPASAGPSSSGGLPRSLPWTGAVVLAAGGALQITLALGPMAEDLGNTQVLVWAGAALIGLVQCLLIAELATLFPGRSGGTATYAHEAFGAGAPRLSSLASWGYWVAWTPGIAVSLLLAAEYLRASVAPEVDTVTFAVVTGGALYLANALGLRAAVVFSTALLVLVALPLLAILGAPLGDPSLFATEAVWPLSVPGDPGTGATVALVVQWLFVATWSAYGGEIASTVLSEVRSSSRGAFAALASAGVLFVVVFAAVPFVMTGLVGSEGLSGQPEAAFLVPAEAVFGRAGAAVVAVMLCGALVLGAQAYIVASSRTVYQMSQDGYLPRFLGHVSRRGVPTRSVLFDAAVIAMLLLVFGGDLVSVIAAANVGYLVVFVLVPLAAAVIRTHHRRHGRATALSRRWTAVALLLAGVNAALLVAGAWLWGPAVGLVGAGLTAAILPLSALRRHLDRRAARRADLADRIPRQRDATGENVPG